jgi:hypothetical protein
MNLSAEDDEGYGPRYFDMNGNAMTFEEWAKEYGGRADAGSRHVGNTYLHARDHVLRVSTVWLGLDHSFWPRGKPLIFETMVFADGDYAGVDGLMSRYSTKAEAIKGHRHYVGVARAVLRSFPKPKQLIHKGGKP